MKTILALTMGWALSTQASAYTRTLWSCDLEGEVSGRRVGWGISYQKLSGDGTLSCKANGQESLMNVPVELKIRGMGIGLGYTKMKKVRIVGMGVGMVKDPKNLAATYRMGPSAGFNLMKTGLDFDTTFNLASPMKDGGGFEIGMMFQEALGADMHFSLKSFQIMAKNSENAVEEKPVEEPTEPVEEPTEPVEEPTEPVEEPTEPVEEPTEPVEEPTEPVEEPTEPVEEPTEPVEEPTEPVEEPTEPVEEPTEPVEEPTEVVEEPIENEGPIAIP